MSWAQTLRVLLCGGRGRKLPLVQGLPKTLGREWLPQGGQDQEAGAAPTQRWIGREASPPSSTGRAGYSWTGGAGGGGEARAGQ